MLKKTKRKIEVLELDDKALDKRIKIQGTEFDRKRTISSKTVKQMLKLSKKGKSIQEIAKELGIGATSIRYNIDPVFKAEFNAKRSGLHTGKTKMDTLNRVAYKRQLVSSGKIKV